MGIFDEFLEINMLTFAVMPHTYKYHQPVHQLYLVSRAGSYSCTYRHIQYTHVVAEVRSYEGYWRTLKDIERVCFYASMPATAVARGIMFSCWSSVPFS